VSAQQRSQRRFRPRTAIIMPLGLVSRLKLFRTVRDLVVNLSCMLERWALRKRLGNAEERPNEIEEWSC